MGEEAGRLKVSQLARLVGIAFQNPNGQFFKLNVRDEIMAGPKALDCYDETWLKELVALFHLEPLLDRAPFRLSGVNSPWSTDIGRFFAKLKFKGLQGVLDPSKTTLSPCSKSRPS